MTEEIKGTPLKEPVTTQEQFDAMIKPRLARLEEKYSDYDTTKQRLAEFEKINNEKTQKELEAQKEYEKLKDGFAKKEQELQGVISKKDADISDMKIEGALRNEIIEQNAYADETMALLKKQAEFDKEGNIRIKGRDSNGLEVLDSVKEGLKKFLTQRPHLVKVTKKEGGGTGGGTGTPGVGVGGDDLASLNVQFAQAKREGNQAKIKELKVKMAGKIASQRQQL